MRPLPLGEGEQKERGHPRHYWWLPASSPNAMDVTRSEGLGLSGLLACLSSDFLRLGSSNLMKESRPFRVFVTTSSPCVHLQGVHGPDHICVHFPGGVP